MGDFSSHHCVLEFPGAFAGHHVAVGGDCADLDGAGDALENVAVGGKLGVVRFGTYLAISWAVKDYLFVLVRRLLAGVFRGIAVAVAAEGHVGAGFVL